MSVVLDKVQKFFWMKADVGNCEIGDVVLVTGKIISNGGTVYNLTKSCIVSEVPNFEQVKEIDPIGTVYKGEDTTIITLVVNHISITVRVVGDKSTTFCVTNKGNTRNSATKVAENKAKLKLKTYVKKKGYSHSREEAIKNMNKITSCSLLRKWDDLKDKLEYPLIGSPKVNGIRAVHRDTNLVSRGGKDIVAKHISSAIKPEHKLDGELYIPHYSLEKIQSVVTSSTHVNKGLLHFFVFDIAKPVPFSERLAEMEIIKGDYDTEHNIHFLPQVVINNEREADDYYEWCLEQGFEGACYRTLGGVYKGDRTPHIIKRKPLITEEFKIYRHTRDKDGLIIFELFTECGQVFKAVPSWSDAERRLKPTYDYYTRAELAYYDVTYRGIPKHGNVTVLRQVNKHGTIEF